MSEWINVKDRLPDNSDWVLAWSKEDQCQCLAHLDGQHDGKWNWHIDPAHSVSFRSVCAITHWMPLPEPPKPEGPFKVHYNNGQFFLSHERYGPSDIDLRLQKRAEDLARWINLTLAITP